jgi:hypothetical protein
MWQEAVVVNTEFPMFVEWLERQLVGHRHSPWLGLAAAALDSLQELRLEAPVTYFFFFLE